MYRTAGPGAAGVISWWGPVNYFRFCYRQKARRGGGNPIPQNF